MRGSSESVLGFRSEVVLGMRGLSATIVVTAGRALQGLALGRRGASSVAGVRRPRSPGSSQA